MSTKREREPRTLAPRWSSSGGDALGTPSRIHLKRGRARACGHACCFVYPLVRTSVFFVFFFSPPVSSSFSRLRRERFLVHAPACERLCAAGAVGGALDASSPHCPPWGSVYRKGAAAAGSGSGGGGSGGVGGSWGYGRRDRWAPVLQSSARPQVRSCNRSAPEFFRDRGRDGCVGVVLFRRQSAVWHGCRRRDLSALSCPACIGEFGCGGGLRVQAVFPLPVSPARLLVSGDGDGTVRRLFPLPQRVCRFLGVFCVLLPCVCLRARVELPMVGKEIGGRR